MTTTRTLPRSAAAHADAALLDVPQALRYLGGISRSTLKLLVWRGKITPTRVGKRVFFTRAALDDYIARHTTETVSPS